MLRLTWQVSSYCHARICAIIYLSQLCNAHFHCIPWIQSLFNALSRMTLLHISKELSVLHLLLYVNLLDIPFHLLDLASLGSSLKMLYGFLIITFKWSHELWLLNKNWEFSLFRFAYALSLESLDVLATIPKTLVLLRLKDYILIITLLWATGLFYGLEPRLFCRNVSLEST